MVPSSAAGRDTAAVRSNTTVKARKNRFRINFDDTRATEAAQTIVSVELDAGYPDSVPSARQDERERIGVCRQPVRIPCVSKAKIEPAKRIDGVVELPGDKSISHRYAMLAGLAEGTSRLSNFSTGADPHSSLACMAALGATVATTGNGPATVIEVTGCLLYTSRCV